MSGVREAKHVEDEFDESSNNEATPKRRRPLQWAARVGVTALVTIAAWGVFAGPSPLTQIGHLHGSSVDAATIPATAPMTRTYFISADEVQWNYAPNGKNMITGAAFGPTEDTYLAAGPGRIGAVNLKAQYREYTNASFTTLKARAPQDQYLGLLGPVIRAQVGDTIKVVFRNATRFPVSMHPHNVFYTKANEGAPYNDGSAPATKFDDGVTPGTTYTYTWTVPDRAGPGPGDQSSILSMYHSHTAEVDDTYAGLIGPMIITARGKAKADGSPVDVDREIINLFQVWNENHSSYLDANIAAATPPAAPLDTTTIKADPDFQESNLKHAINGFVYGNGPQPTMKLGQRVRWYEFSMGSEVDLHTPHVHGNVWTNSMGMRMDMTGILPGEMVTLDMVPDNPGTWLFHCHVNDHITAGMIGTYIVQ